jgi:hypothetical protein
MIIPDWQYPHCGASNSFHAIWIGWLPSDESPSMVRIGLPIATEAGTLQDRIARPSTCTVHAPALADAAAELRAGQTDQIADDPEQWCLLISIDSMHRPIDREIKRQCFSDKHVLTAKFAKFSKPGVARPRKKTDLVFVLLRCPAVVSCPSWFTKSSED